MLLENLIKKRKRKKNLNDCNTIQYIHTSFELNPLSIAKVLKETQNHLVRSRSNSLIIPTVQRSSSFEVATTQETGGRALTHNLSLSHFLLLLLFLFLVLSAGACRCDIKKKNSGSFWVQKRVISFSLNHFFYHRYSCMAFTLNPSLFLAIGSFIVALIFMMLSQVYPLRYDMIELYLTPELDQIPVDFF